MIKMVFISRNKMFRFFKAWYFKKEDAGHSNELSYSKNGLLPESLLFRPWTWTVQWTWKSIAINICTYDFMLSGENWSFSIIFFWNYCLFSEFLCNFVMACCLFFGMNSENSTVRVKTIVTSILKKSLSVVTENESPHFIVSNG